MARIRQPPNRILSGHFRTSKQHISRFCLRHSSPSRDIYSQERPSEESLEREVPKSESPSGLSVGVVNVLALHELTTLRTFRFVSLAEKVTSPHMSRPQGKASGQGLQEKLKLQDRSQRR